MFVKLFGLLVMWLATGYVILAESTLRHVRKICNGNVHDFYRYSTIFAEIAKQYAESSWSGYVNNTSTKLLKVLNFVWNWVTWPSLIPTLQEAWEATDERWIGIKNES